MDQKKQLRVLRGDWATCERCDLHKARKGNIVFGAGSIPADYFFLYDIPTGDDVYTTNPMSGEHGELLLELMREAGIDSKRAYCTPLLGCRPTTFIPATSDAAERIVDRTPEKLELSTCKPRVLSLLYALDPRLIFAMGELAWKQLVKTKDRAPITSFDKARGDVFIHRHHGIYCPEISYPVIPLLSIKQILQNPSAAKHGPLTLTIKDMLKGRTYVEHLKNYEVQDGSTRA